MVKNKIITTEKIKKELIKSCLEFETKRFIPFLLSKNVYTRMPNKIRFYKFFKSMINSTKRNTFGKLSYKLKEIENEKKIYLNFYDEKHKNPQLTIEIIQTEERIHLDTLPF